MKENTEILDSIFESCKSLGLTVDVLSSFIKSDLASDEDILDLVSTIADAYTAHLAKLQTLIPTLTDITLSIKAKAEEVDEDESEE